MKRYLYSILALVTLLIYLHIFYANQMQVIIWLALGLFALSAICIVFFGGWYLSEKMKMLRAARIDLEKQAHVLQLHNANQTWIRDTDHDATWHALHLEQRVYSNGQYYEPSETEREAWREYHRPTRVIESKQQLALPESTTPLDLITVLNQSERCLIVGASKSGKTTVLQHLVQAKQSNSKVIIIDPHAYPGKWSIGCEVYGLGRDYAAIDDTLARLIGLMTQRYQEIAKGNLVHSPVTVVIDEWRAITHNLDNAAGAIKTLLTESRKANFSIFVASHSDRAKPLGLQGEYDLKQGFTVIRLIFDTYRHFATVDFGEGQQSLTLPGAFSEPLQGELVDIVDLPEIELTEREQSIMDLYKQGMKPTPIAEKVFGSKGGNQVSEVRECIARWG